MYTNVNTEEHTGIRLPFLLYLHFLFSKFEFGNITHPQWNNCYSAKCSWASKLYAPKHKLRSYAIWKIYTMSMITYLPKENYKVYLEFSFIQWNNWARINFNTFLTTLVTKYYFAKWRLWYLKQWKMSQFSSFFPAIARVKYSCELVWNPHCLTLK